MAAPKLRFKEFDGDWTSSDFSKASVQIIDGDRGFNYPKSDDFYDDEFCLFLNAGNVTKQGFNFENTQFITKNKDSSLRKGKLERNDLVITTRGTVGNVAYFNDSVSFKNMRINSGMVIARCQKNVLADFINQFLNSDLFEKWLDKNAFGSAQPQLTVKLLNSIDLNYPSKPEQTKIASFLSAVDEKISQLTQKHQLLSQYKQGMMQKLFSQQIRFKADDGSEFGEWDFIELGTATDVTKLAGYEFTKHIVYKDSGNLIALRGLNVKNNKLDLSDVKYIDDSDLKMLGRSKLYIDDLIFTYVGTIGDVALIQENEKFYLAPNVARIRANKELLNPVYLLQYFNETSFRRNEIEKYIATSSQPALSMTNIRKFHIAKPCLDEQTKIANLLSAIDQKVEVVAQQIEQAKIWKKGLLQQMFV